MWKKEQFLKVFYTIHPLTDGNTTLGDEMRDNATSTEHYGRLT